MIEFKENVFHLATENASYIIGVWGGELLNLYYGKRMYYLPELARMLPEKMLRPFSCVDINVEGISASTDNLRAEYPTFGNADLRSPAFSAVYSDGTAVTRFKYVDYEITDGKYKLQGLPAVYAQMGDNVSSLKITLKDDVCGVTAELLYSVFENYNAITRSVRIINSGDSAFDISKVMSLSIDFPRADFDMITLNGAWARERIPERSSLTFGDRHIESARGFSSHNANPFFILADKNANEDVGEVYGFSFAYSGNFILGAQKDSFNTTRAYMGINPQNFLWRLEAGASFTAPEAVLVYSDSGIGKMSRIFHKLYRERLCRGAWRDACRPVLINSWEAAYFSFDEEKILNIAKTAKDVGIELAVLDDGWFKGRNNDKSSLGDWIADTNKLPNGIDGLAKKIISLGMKFGIWIEPEMVSPDSDLYRAHPDWCLHIKGREPSLGRNQLVLDLTRDDVKKYIKTVFDNLLSGGYVSYVKWDMNRSITEAGTDIGGYYAQGKVYHNYVLGLYEIMEYAVTKYPDVLFEGCAGGGGRFDPAILYYMPQIWTSDDTDALERIYIQYGTSLCYPYSAMGAHVSEVPNHQVGRITPMKMRGDVSICGQLGYELDISKLNESDIGCIRRQIADYRRLNDVFHKGDLYRLITPFGNNAAVNQFISEDKNTVVLCTYILKGLANAPYENVKLRSLCKDALYRDDDGNEFTGEYLMNFGITIKYDSDYQSNLTVLKRI